MARNERYVTTVELNSQQAQDRLEELKKRVQELKKAKEEAVKNGGFFDEASLKKATKELNQWKVQMTGVQGILDNINDVTLEDLQKGLRNLKLQSKSALPGTQEFTDIQQGIGKVEDRIKELRNAYREAKSESEQLSASMDHLVKVMQNVKGASLNDLLSAQKILEQNVASARPGSSSYDTALLQLREVKGRIQEIKQEQQLVVTLMDKYEQETKQVNKSLKETEWETGIVENTMKNLSKASVRDLEFSIKLVNEQLRKLPRGTAEFDRMQERARKLRTELERVRYEGAAQQPWISRMADFFNKVQGTVIVGLSSITGLTLTVRRAIQAFADMDQEMENVRKYTGQTTEQVHEMNEEFKRLDTRTSREKLNQLAGDAGRLGIQGKEAIMEFVDAADKINVALGDDLGENAVKNIGKLAMAFGTDKEMGLRGAMLATGSAVNELAQNSSAAAGYLVDFTARVAGFGRQVGLSQTQIMGFGAVMDENMLRDEMAATAFGQLLVKMTTDIETFARITGMKTEAFKKMVTEDINGAILAVARSLKGRDMQDLGKVFDAMNLDGQRAISVLSTLGQKVEDVEKRQRIASEAFNEGKSVIEEFNVQNQTVQADLDKAKKKFNDLRIELGEKLLPVARYGITTGAMLIKLLAGLMSVISEYKATLVLLTTTIGLLVLKKEADVLITKAEVFWNEKLVATSKNLWKVLARNPYAALAAAAMMAIGFIIDLTRKTKENIEVEDKLNKMRVESRKKMADEKATVETLIAASKNEKLSLEERLKAIGKLERIIPGYVTQLNKETGAYVENKKALDDYLVSLARKYEIEGAKDMLKEIGRDLADLNTQYNNAYELAVKAKELEAKGNGRSAYNPAESQFLSANTQKAQKDLDDVNKAIEKKLEERRKIYAVYGVEIQKETANTVDPGEDTGNNPLFTDPKADEKKRKAAEAAAKKLAAQQARELRERNNAIKAQTEADMAIVTNSYARGEIDYRTYVRKIDAIQIDGFTRRMAIYQEESDEYKKLLNDREQYALKAQEKQERLSLKDVEKEHNEVTARIEASFYNPKDSENYLNEQAVNEALYKADIIYMQEKAKLYKKGSEERVEIEEEIEEMEREHRLENERYYFEMLQQVRERYLEAGNDVQLQIALNGLDDLHEKGLLKEEEYQRAKIAVQAQYASYQSPSEQARKTGSDMLKVASDKAREQVGDNGSTPIVGTIRQYQATMEQLKVLYASDKENHAAYLAAKQQATAEFCAEMAAQFQAAYDSIGQILSAASSYFSASQEYETNEVKKKYEKQIAAAGNNQKKVKKLQEKQAKEEAAIKSKYNARAVKIQVAQAIASTALSAINAYSSAAQVPLVGYILAPLAAAAATAAGMIQVAAIKKQAQAQEAGYYTGGYTGGRRYRKEAGVVHEGEFVANHRAVNNPGVRPVLDLIDRAQRNNTVGSLTADDISRQLGNGASAVVAPVVNVQNDNGELRDTLDQSREVNERLADILSNGIVAVSDPEQTYKDMKMIEKLKRNAK